MVSGCVFCAKIEAGGDEHGPILARVDGMVHAVAVFEPLNPVTRGHMLFVPVRHVERSHYDYLDAVADASKAAALYGARLPAYNLVVSVGEVATQTVPHLHVHLVPRREGDGLALPWTGQGGA